MVTPTPPPPSPLDLNAPQFPVEAARELASELKRLALKLDDAKGARARAERNLTEFMGGVADQYREDLRRHIGHLDDTIAQFRRMAGLLHDAITEHEEALRQHWREEHPFPIYGRQP